MSKDLCGTSTGVTGENEPVITNEPEGIALKTNPVQPLGRQAASSGKVFFLNKQTKALRLFFVGFPHCPARSR